MGEAGLLDADAGPLEPLLELPCEGSRDLDPSSAKRQLTRVAYDNTDATWSPDGKKIAFLSTRNGGDDVYVMNADGSGQKRLT